MSPRSPRQDIVDGPAFDVIDISKLRCSESGCPDGKDFLFCELRRPVRTPLERSSLESPHSYAMLDVTLASNPFKVLDTVISSVAVYVVDLVTGFGNSKECHCNKPVDKMGTGWPLNGSRMEIDKKVSVLPARARFENSPDHRSVARFLSSDGSMSRHGIHSFKPDDRQPFRIVSHE